MLNEHSRGEPPEFHPDHPMGRANDGATMPTNECRRYQLISVVNGGWQTMKPNGVAVTGIVRLARLGCSSAA